MERSSISQLQADHPDITKSSISDVLRATGGSKQQAANVLNDMKAQKLMDQQRVVQEAMDAFPGLPVDEIVEILEKQSYNMEESLPHMLAAWSMFQQKAKNSKDKSSRNQEAVEQLLAVFQNIPKKTIVEILDQNDGDIEDTTNELLTLLSLEASKAVPAPVPSAKQEELPKANSNDPSVIPSIQQAKLHDPASHEQFVQDQKKRASRLAVEVLTLKFDEFTEKDATDALEACNGNVEDACKLLLEKGAERSRKRLQAAYPHCDEKEIEHALQEAKWDGAKAAEILSQLPKNVQPDEKQEDDNNIHASFEDGLLNVSLIIAKQVHQEMNSIRQDRMDKVRQHVADYLQKETRDGELAPNKMEDGSPALSVREDAPLISSIVADNKEMANTPVLLEIQTDSLVDTGMEIKLKVTHDDSFAYDSYNWVGLYEVNSTDGQYLANQYVPAGKSSELVFYAPKNYGSYHFRYFKYKYERVAISAPVDVRPTFAVNAELDEKTNQIIFSFKQKTGHQYTWGWAGLFKSSQSSSGQYISYKWLSSTQDGTLRFDAPFKPGQYDVRLFVSRYTENCRSNSVTISGSDSLHAQVDSTDKRIHMKLDVCSVDPYCDKVWIGLYEDGAKNGEWIKYKKPSNRIGELSTAQPKKAGKYQLRLFANGSMEPVVVSNVFDVKI